MSGGGGLSAMLGTGGMPGASVGMEAAKGAMQAIGGGKSSAESSGEVSMGGDQFNFAPPPASGAQATADTLKRLAPWLAVAFLAWLVLRK